MTNIENVEVRGLTTKQLLWLLMFTITIVSSVVLGYTKIVYQLEQNQIGVGALQIQIETIKIEQKTANANQQAIDLRLTRMEEQLNGMKNH